MHSSNKNGVLQEIKKMGQFTSLPNEIFDQGLTPVAFYIWSYIMSLPDSYESTVSSVAKKLDLHRTTVYQAINELESKNMIEIVKKDEYKGLIRLITQDNWESDQNIVQKMYKDRTENVQYPIVQKMYKDRTENVQSIVQKMYKDRTENVQSLDTNNNKKETIKERKGETASPSVCLTDSISDKSYSKKIPDLFTSPIELPSDYVMPLFKENRDLSKTRRNAWNSELRKNIRNAIMTANPNKGHNIVSEQVSVFVNFLIKPVKDGVRINGSRAWYKYLTGQRKEKPSRSKPPVFFTWQVDDDMFQIILDECIEWLKKPDLFYEKTKWTKENYELAIRQELQEELFSDDKNLNNQEYDEKKKKEQEQKIWEEQKRIADIENANKILNRLNSETISNRSLEPNLEQIEEKTTQGKPNNTKALESMLNDDSNRWSNEQKEMMKKMLEYKSLGK